MKSDFSQTNPEQHKLYVEYAYDVLSVLDEALKAFEEHFRTDSFIAIDKILQIRNDMIEEDAAYRDAALLRYMRKNK
jgi:hypothetical protein